MTTNNGALRPDLRGTLAETLAPLALAREYLMANPDACPAPRNDGCPECGAFPEVAYPARSYRAFIPSGTRCTSAWHTPPVNATHAPDDRAVTDWKIGGAL